jgi:hypothetical protein
MLRIFDYVFDDGNSRQANWRFGEGTVNAVGDYYHGDEYVERSGWASPEILIAGFGSGVRERILIPFDMRVDEGL